LNGVGALWDLVPHVCGGTVPHVCGGMGGCAGGSMPLGAVRCAPRVNLVVAPQES